MSLNNNHKKYRVITIIPSFGYVSERVKNNNLVSITDFKKIIKGDCLLLLQQQQILDIATKRKKISLCASSRYTDPYYGYTNYRITPYKGRQLIKQFYEQLPYLVLLCI